MSYYLLLRVFNIIQFNYIEIFMGSNVYNGVKSQIPFPIIILIDAKYSIHN